MQLLEIKKYPDPVLRKKSEKVEKITPEIKEFGLKLAETMEKKDGIGLASTQVGELKRIIAVQDKEGPQVLVNPRITQKSFKKIVLEEGCLSLPGIWLNVKRPAEIKFKAQDLEGRNLSGKAVGISARVIQHEIDHLDGILMIDRIGFLEKIKKKLKLFDK